MHIKLMCGLFASANVSVCCVIIKCMQDIAWYKMHNIGLITLSLLFYSPQFGGTNANGVATTSSINIYSHSICLHSNFCLPTNQQPISCTCSALYPHTHKLISLVMGMQWLTSCSFGCVFFCVFIYFITHQISGNIKYGQKRGVELRCLVLGTVHEHSF